MARIKLEAIVVHKQTTRLETKIKVVQCNEADIEMNDAHQRYGADVCSLGAMFLNLEPSVEFFFRTCILDIRPRPAIVIPKKVPCP